MLLADYCCALQQKEIDFLHNENQLLEGYLQRVRASCPTMVASCDVNQLLRAGRRISPCLGCRRGATGTAQATLLDFISALPLRRKAFLQKGSTKKRGTSRGGGKKEEWHGLTLEEKNEIVSTEIEIYQAAIEKVGIYQVFMTALLPVLRTYVWLFTNIRHRKLVSENAWRLQQCSAK